jgi:hypothetical protein
MTSYPCYLCPDQFPTLAQWLRHAAQVHGYRLPPGPRST